MHRPLTVILVVISILVSTSAFAKWNENSKSPQQTEILNKIEKMVKETDQPVVIFDLDSTLYKNYSRWAVIVREFGKEKKIDELKNFKKEQISDSWDMKRILRDDAKLSEDVVKKIISDFKNFWGQRFFHSDYVNRDEALPGAVDYVKNLHSLGAYIIYITGRDEPNMKKGTEAKLKADGFPYGVNRTFLIMKPISNTSLKNKTKDAKEYAELINKTDKEFKSGAVSKAKSFGNVIASFDNEPRHINLYYNAFHNQGQGVAVFMDTDHSKNPTTIESGIVSVNGFLQ